MYVALVISPFVSADGLRGFPTRSMWLLTCLDVHRYMRHREGTKVFKSYSIYLDTSILRILDRAVEDDGPVLLWLVVGRKEVRPSSSFPFLCFFGPLLRNL